MRFDLARRTLFALVTTASFAAFGCSTTREALEDTEVSTDPIVDVDGTAPKRQAIGNCWLYATASWAESLAKQAGGGDLNMSESYWTYWHWFDQIANGSVSTEVTTGGWYHTAAEIIARYGIMSEEAFISTEGTEERSLRQKAALAKINESLKTGALSTDDARHDRELVRRELDAAFELPEEIVSQMNQVFGSGVHRTLDRSHVDTNSTAIRRAKDIPALLRDPETHAPVQKTLADAIGTRGSGFGVRTGRYAWNTVGYRYTQGRRDVLARMQRAMHDGQPVILSWLVDFAAMDTTNRFLAPPATPGSQGGHMVVVDDYQIHDVPGFGTLPIDVAETRSDALQAALAPEAKIEFIRVKNSWGTHRPDPEAIGPGFNDLYMAYLDGPIKQCTQVSGTSDPNSCWDTTPLNEFIMPPGY